MRPSLLSALFVTAIVGNAEAKPGAILVPPMEVDFGVGTPIGNSNVTSSTELRAGVHWASLSWKPTWLDVGIGYAGSWRGIEPMYFARTSDGTIEDQTLALHGVYVELGYAIENEKNWRTWIGGRVEGFTGKLNDNDIVAVAKGRSAERELLAVGGALRIATEFYIPGVKGVGDARTLGFYAGTWALGIYVEGSQRSLPAELGPLSVAAGVTARVPFILAIGT